MQNHPSWLTGLSSLPLNFVRDLTENDVFSLFQFLNIPIEESKIVTNKWNGYFLTDVLPGLNDQQLGEFGLRYGDARTIMDWVKRSTLETKPLHTNVDDYSQNMVYQNNNECVKHVGVVFLENSAITENRYRKLVVNFANYGLGKTRFGIEFQQLFKKALQDNTSFTYQGDSYSNYKECIDEFQQESVDSLLQAKMIYIDFNVVNKSLSLDNILASFIVGNLHIPGPRDGVSVADWVRSLEIPLYLVLDEIQEYINVYSEGFSNFCIL